MEFERSFDNKVFDLIRRTFGIGEDDDGMIDDLIDLLDGDLSAEDFETCLKLSKERKLKDLVSNITPENKHSPFDEEFNCKRCGDAIVPGTNYYDDCSEDSDDLINYLDVSKEWRLKFGTGVIEIDAITHDDEIKYNIKTFDKHDYFDEILGKEQLIQIRDVIDQALKVK